MHHLHKSAIPYPATPGSMLLAALRRQLLISTLGLVLLLAAVGAGAHIVSKGLATITVEQQTLQYNLALQLAAAPQNLNDTQFAQVTPHADYSSLLKAIEKSIHIEVDGGLCPTTASSIAPPNREGGTVAVQLLFTCAREPKEVTLRDDLFDVLGPGYHTIANIQWSGGSRQFVFLPSSREIRVNTTEGVTTAGLGSFILLGIEHILTGYDHLLFLLVLVLRGGNIWSLFKIVTAFTVAHSVTLALAALNIIELPERLIEATIALSIAYVAAENLFTRQPASRRWAVAFIFGLVHGAGFSTALHELGIPEKGLVWALLNFNLGVEVGQAMALAIAVPLLRELRRFRWEPRATVATSIAAFVVSLTLFVNRAFISLY